MERIDMSHDFVNNEATGTDEGDRGKLNGQHNEHLSRYQTASSHLRSTFANPTPMPLMGFLIASTPLGCNLMGWRGSGGGGAAIIGLFFFFGGMLQILGCVLEWILGNTFPFVVFASYVTVSIGAFWLAMGATLQPEFNAQSYYVDPSATPAVQSAGQAEFYSSFGFFFMVMSLLTFFYVVASLRTNVVFFLVFLFIDLAFLMLTACYWTLAQGMTVIGHNLQIAAGAFIFVFCILGWYLFFALILLAVDFPFAMPVGDLSTRIKSATDRKKAMEAKA
ncbi:hypothetical protein D0Z07_6692 [Hyphodiscus hymeniophilus]|uniref:GPR1/FUN34/YaaH-class plasma membrane protein n=1 Tax=Hyphodiscus hymeniophilus TaxID=353542 RepID=A0A9P7AVG8_9HELO|nr:hypothetical protein D0Z07_6692 [Hyphodiscus hymeniophilus]